MRLTPVAAAVAALALAVASSPPAARGDEVVLRNGRTEKGNVVQENYATVTVTIQIEGQPRGIPFPYPWDQVDRIDYDGLPAAYERGESLLRAREFGPALEQWAQVKAKNPRAVLRQHALYRVALCLHNLGKFDAAIAAYEELLKEFPTSRWFASGWKGMVACHLAEKSYDAAALALGRATAEAARLRDLPPGVPLELRLLKGRLLEETGKPKEAQVEYQAVAASAAAGLPGDPGSAARLGHARCLLALADPAGAERLFREVAERAGASVLLTQAHNGLGACHYARAQADPSLAAWKRALFDYLHGVTLCNPNSEEGAEESAEAFFQAAKCLERIIALPDVDDLTHDRYAGRALDLYGELVDDFPKSKLAEPAKEAEKALRAALRHGRSKGR